MTTRNITIAVIVSVIAGVLLWDAVAATNDVDGDTVSEVLAGWATAYPIVAFLAGCVCGHLFWPMIEGKK